MRQYATFTASRPYFRIKSRFIEVFVCYHLKSFAVNKEVGPTHLLTWAIPVPPTGSPFFYRAVYGKLVVLQVTL